MELIGKAAVEECLERQIEKAESLLFAAIKDRESEFLTLVMSLTSETIPQWLSSCHRRSRARRVFDMAYDLMQVVDSLHGHGFSSPLPILPTDEPNLTITHADPSTIETTMRNLFAHFDRISYPKTILTHCRASNYYKIEIDEKGLPRFDTNLFRRARSAWLASAIKNNDWESYFHEMHDSDEFAEEMSGYLLREYGFSLATLVNLDKEIDRVMCEGRRKGASYCIIDREEIVKKLNEALSRGETRCVLENLVYSEGRSFAECLFFPVVQNGVDCFWIRQVPGGLAVPWVAKAAEVGGQLKDKYGKAFDTYIRERICNKATFELVDNEITVRKQRYIEAKESFDKYGRQEFKVDVLAWDDHKAYIISCKAHDFFFDARLYSSLMYMPYKEFYNRTCGNHRDLKEVLMWVDILKDTRKFQEQYGLTGKDFVPLLVTSLRDPLQIPEVRMWARTMKPIPRCEQFSIVDFERKLASS